MRLKIEKHCLACGNILNDRRKIFCDNKCQGKFYRDQYIERWKAGEETGDIGKVFKGVSGYVRSYLFEKFDNKCSRCGWGEVNPASGKIPLEVEHIDGDFTNNAESNLTLLCPNCHSLTHTWKGLNKGNGRPYRKQYYDK